MPASISPVGPALDIVSSIIHLLNPSDLERLKAEIRKAEEAHREREKRGREAVAAGDIAVINALLFGDNL